MFRDIHFKPLIERLEVLAFERMRRRPPFAADGDGASKDGSKDPLDFDFGMDGMDGRARWIGQRLIISFIGR